MMFKVIIYKEEEGFYLGEKDNKTIIVKETKSFIEAKRILEQKWYELVEFYTGRAKERNSWIRTDPEYYTIRIQDEELKLDLIID